MVECSECNGTVDAKSEDVVCCSICQSKIHMECFLKGTSLDSENSTSTRTTRKHSVTTLTSDTIKATLSSKCVLVLCDKCKSSGDIKNLLKKMYESVSRSDLQIQELSNKVEGLTKQVEKMKETSLSSNILNGEVEAMKKDVKKALDSATKVANDVDSTLVKEKMEAAWTEVVNKKRPGVLPMKTILKEQLEQVRMTEEKKSNLIIHVLKPVDGVPDIDQFMEIVDGCGISGSITAEDVVECKRLGAKKDNVIQPLKIVLSSVEKKRELFRNLGKWRAKLLADKDRDPLEKLPHVDHDLTKEQRIERKSLVEIAVAKQAELPKESPFRIRVRGAPEDMKVVKIDANGKWTILHSSLLK